MISTDGCLYLFRGGAPLDQPVDQPRDETMLPGQGKEESAWLSVVLCGVS